MNSPAHDLALVIEAAGLGAFGGNAEWSLHVAGEPAQPDNVVTLYDVPGGEPDTDQLDVFRPSIQVRVRCRDYTAGYDRQEAIRDLLQAGSIEAPTSRFTVVLMSSDIMNIGRDESNRYLLTATYRTRRSKKEA